MTILGAKTHSDPSYLFSLFRGQDPQPLGSTPLLHGHVVFSYVLDASWAWFSKSAIKLLGNVVAEFLTG